ncbi:HAD family hydrolase [Streptomyces sp. NPDC002004]
MEIRAVVWDIDDTIFDYAGADTAGMRAHLAAEGLLGRYGTAEAALTLWRELTDRHWARFGAGAVGFQEQRRDRVRDFLAVGGSVAGPMDDADADAWFGRYVRHYEAAWALFPDTLPALDALAGDYRHAVLSNSALTAQDRKLRALGVRDRFEAVLCAAELGVSKPAPEAFLAACDALGLRPSEVAYVGDQPETDARGASDAGLLGIWLDRNGSGGVREELPSGVHRITGLAELPGLLRADTRFGAPSTFG